MPCIAVLLRIPKSVSLTIPCDNEHEERFWMNMGEKWIWKDKFGFEGLEFLGLRL